MLRHIPNAITCIRILIAAVFPFCPESMHLGLILVGLASEFLDGFTARIFKWTSYLGQVLDPFADKLFVLSVSLTWVWLDKLSVVQWLLLGLRDFGVLFIFIALILRSRIRTVESVSARFPSKLTTAFQYLVFGVVLMDRLELLMPLVLVTAAAGLVATIHYAYLLKHEFH